MKAVIFDLDNTICDISDRIDLITGDEKDYDAFNNLCDKDKVHDDILEIMNVFWTTGHSVIFSTGRSEEYRQKTERWLKQKCKVLHPLVHMRDKNDIRSDVDVKKEHLGFIRTAYDVLCAFDDRDKVVQMYRDNGVRCLQVKESQY